MERAIFLSTTVRVLFVMDDLHYPKESSNMLS